MTNSEQFKTIRIEALHINYQTDYQFQQDAFKKIVHQQDALKKH